MLQPSPPHLRLQQSLEVHRFLRVLGAFVCDMKRPSTTGGSHTHTRAAHAVNGNLRTRLFSPFSCAMYSYLIHAS
jgi:hypothetical protein